MPGDPYVVEVKPSARRANGAVGRVVNREGVRREFTGREAAETWAAGLTSRGGRHVWIRGANPNDPAPVDAYLMGRRPPPGDERPPDFGPNGVADDAGLAADWAAADGANGAATGGADDASDDPGPDDGDQGEGDDASDGVPEYGDLTAIHVGEDGADDGPGTEDDGE